MLPKLPGDLHVCRDNAVLWQQHAQAATVEDTARNFTDYLKASADAKDPDFVERQKQLAAATKLVQKHEAKERKEAEKQAAKQAERDSKAPADADFNAMSKAGQKAFTAKK